MQVRVGTILFAMGECDEAVKLARQYVNGLSRDDVAIVRHEGQIIVRARRNFVLTGRLGVICDEPTEKGKPRNESQP